MKKEVVTVAKHELKKLKEKKITRKEAIKKTGIMAFSAAATMLLLNTPAQAYSSPAAPPEWR